MTILRISASVIDNGRASWIIYDIFMVLETAVTGHFQAARCNSTMTNGCSACVM